MEIIPYTAGSIYGDQEVKDIFLSGVRVQNLCAVVVSSGSIYTRDYEVLY